MKTCVIAVLIAFVNFPALLEAQDLHIFYDVSLDSIYYVRSGRAVQQPHLKHKEEAVLHVINYNDYLYDLKLSTETEDYSIPSSGTASLFSLGNNSTALSQLGNLAGGLSGTGFGLQGTNLAEGADGMVETSKLSNETRQLVRSFTQSLNKMKETEEKLQELAEYLEQDIQAQQLNGMVLQEVQRLQKHPSLSPAKIKKLALGYMKPVLRFDREEELEVSDLLERSNTGAMIQQSVQQYEEQSSQLDAELQALSATSQLLMAVPAIPADDKKALAATYRAAEQRVQSYGERALRMKQELAGAKDLTLAELVDIGYLYEEMKEHRFEKQFLVRPETDLTTLKLKLQPIDSSGVAGVRTRSLKPIALETYGGLKVNASLGISFVGYFDRPQDYFLRDSVIVGDDQDAFLPIISSFFHFYPQSKRQVSVGGTFGLGIGIGGDAAGLQNYFFGPSLILGREQRVVFSTGLMGGRVERLGEGYAVGDVYEAGGILPTKSVYELGYFLGISFNLLGG